MNDKVHHFNRGVNDTKAFSHFGEGITEKLVVKLNDNLLLTSGIVNTSGTGTNTGVEFIEGFGFFL